MCMGVWRELAKHFPTVTGKALESFVVLLKNLFLVFNKQTSDSFEGRRLFDGSQLRVRKGCIPFSRFTFPLPISVSKLSVCAVMTFSDC